MKDSLYQLRNYLTYRLERFLIRGTFYRLLAIVLVLIAISLLAGGLMIFLSEDFRSFGDAVWWAFLRLTDPGYLGDDEGYFRRSVSTVVTIFGYVLFMGSLVAIMTQWLNSTLQRLERGETPISRDNHILILGWTERVPVIVRELLLSEGRVKRFLRLFGESSLQIVILADGESAEFQSELRTHLGPLWDERKVTIRSGNRLRLQHLHRVAFTRAAACIIPASDFAAEDDLDADSSVIKTLLTANQALENFPGKEPPRVVVELKNKENVTTAKRAYLGNVQVIVGVDFIGKLIVQNIRNPGLSHILSCLLTHSDGSALYVKSMPEAIGKTVGVVASALTEATFLGTVATNEEEYSPSLCPEENLKIKEGSQVLALAKEYDDLKLEDFSKISNSPAKKKALAHNPSTSCNKILVLGWNEKAQALAIELSAYTEESYQVTFVSRTPIEERDTAKDKKIISSLVKIRHIEANFERKSSISDIELTQYTTVVALASTKLHSKEEADARTLMGYLHLRDLLRDEHPNVIVELLDNSNAALVDTRFAEHVPSGQLLSHLIAQVALRPELLSVFENLFGYGGADIQLIPLSTYELQDSTYSVSELSKFASERGHILIGALEFGEEVRLILSHEEERLISTTKELKLAVIAKSSAR